MPRRDEGQDRLRDLPRAEKKKDLPMSAMAVLLADLAAQHEQLGAVSQQLHGTILSVQTTARRVQQLLLSVDALPMTPRELEVDVATLAMKRAFKPEPLCIEKPRRAIGDDEEVELVSAAVPKRRPEPIQVLYHSEHEPLPSGNSPSARSEWHHKVGNPMLTRQNTSSRGIANPDLVPETVLTGNHLSAWELLEESGRRDRAPGHGPQVSKKDSDSPVPTLRAGSGLDDYLSAIPPPRMSQGSSGSAVSWSEEMNEIRKKAVLRLQARLGKKTNRGRVSAQQIHKAVTSLGLIKYSEADIKDWLAKMKSLADAVELIRQKQTSTPNIVVDITNMVKENSNRLRNTFGNRLGSRFSTATSLGSEDSDAPQYEHLCRFKSLVEVLLDDEALADLETEYQNMSLTIREVLFSGDANRLVAELTNMRVDDVAAPGEKIDLLNYLEPLVGLVILVQGVVIGVQSGMAERAGRDPFFWANISFTAFFFFEIIFRVVKKGCVAFFTGADKWWNFFDIFLIFVASADLVLEAMVESSQVAPFTMMRILRLMRLTRLLRIFRFRYMKELSLMIKGILGGLYTLFWAMVLLFFTLYVISILAVNTIGKNAEDVPEVMNDELFSSVPRAIFTSFRCFMGDCVTSTGKPIIKLLSDSYGPVFVLCYFAAMMFVSFGLFNLIMAIYIEQTMNSAKMEGDRTKAQRQRESVRIARLTRQLLKKFCAAQRLFIGLDSNEASYKEVKKIMNAAVFDDLGEISGQLSKEMFLCIIQDHGVQKLMDELDIPPDRANLFDILDADGSGGLEVTELITGLLRVRGEAKKSDVVGTLLSVRCVQDMLRDQNERMTRLEFHLGIAMKPQSKMVANR